jgi:hypothetical protein
MALSFPPFFAARQILNTSVATFDLNITNVAVPETRLRDLFQSTARPQNVSFRDLT